MNYDYRDNYETENNMTWLDKPITYGELFGWLSIAISVALILSLF